MQTRPLRIVLAVALTAGFAMATTSAQGHDSKKPEDAAAPSAKAQVGQDAPDFTLTDAAGTKHTLSDYKDKLVVLQWVNQQCPWSLKAIPAIKELQKKYDQKGVVWLGIESTHWRKAEENVQYAKEKELNFPILMDNEGTVGRLYGAKTTPHLYVINKGKLVYAGALHNNQQGDKKAGEVRNYLDDALAAVLAGKDVPLAETTPWGCSVKYKEESKASPREAPKDSRK